MWLTVTNTLAYCVLVFITLTKIQTNRKIVKNKTIIFLKFQLLQLQLQITIVNIYIKPLTFPHFLSPAILEPLTSGSRDKHSTTVLLSRGLHLALGLRSVYMFNFGVLFGAQGPYSQHLFILVN
jgi:hypothetical protein